VATRAVLTGASGDQQDGKQQKHDECQFAP